MKAYLYPFLGLDGEGEDGVGPAALPVHGGGGHPPVHPAGGQDIVGISGRGDAVFGQPVHVHPMLDVLPEVWALVKVADNWATEHSIVLPTPSKYPATPKST